MIVDNIIRALGLFDSLMALTESNKAFYYKDHFDECTNRTYRIFNYRLAQYSEFQDNPAALESRGIMFDATTHELVCRPMHKFFNCGEGNVTDAGRRALCVMHKLDGSLISTWIDRFGDLRLKSKGSISSEQVSAASRWLSRSENRQFYQMLKQITKSDYTVNLEWISPENRIVVPYQSESLRILNLRSLYSGEYVFPNEDLFDRYIQIDQKYIVKCEMPAMNLDAISAMTGIEGFVVVFADGGWLKYKTDWYTVLHKSKDSVINDSALFEVCLKGQSDDLKYLFSDDAWALNKISEMEKKVFDAHNSLVYDVEKFVEDNRNLERKEFAIKAKEFPWMCLAMNGYQNKFIDYEKYLMNIRKSIIGESDNE